MGQVKGHWLCRKSFTWNTGSLEYWKDGFRGMGTISENVSASILINPEMFNIVIPNSAVVAMAYYGEVSYSNIPLFHHSN